MGPQDSDAFSLDLVTLTVKSEEEGSIPWMLNTFLKSLLWVLKGQVDSMYSSVSPTGRHRDASPLPELSHQLQHDVSC